MNDVVRNLCYIIISSCSITLVKYLCSVINKKINELQINTELKQYEKLNQYLDSAQEAISNVVLTVTQTYVESLKKKGCFDEAAQIEAKNRAVTMAKQLLTEESQKAIIAVYESLDVYLDSAIEALVQYNK